LATDTPDDDDETAEAAYLMLEEILGAGATLLTSGTTCFL